MKLTIIRPDKDVEVVPFVDYVSIGSKRKLWLFIEHRNKPAKLLAFSAPELLKVTIER